MQELVLEKNHIIVCHVSERWFPRIQVLETFIIVSITSWQLCMNTVSIVLQQALMTFEDEKIAQATAALEETQTRCEKKSGFKKSQHRKHSKTGSHVSSGCRGSTVVFLCHSNSWFSFRSSALLKSHFNNGYFNKFTLYILIIFIIVSSAKIKCFPALRWCCNVVVGNNRNCVTALLGVSTCDQV